MSGGNSLATLQHYQDSYVREWGIAGLEKDKGGGKGEAKKGKGKDKDDKNILYEANVGRGRGKATGMVEAPLRGFGEK